MLFNSIEFAADLEFLAVMNQFQLEGSTLTIHKVFIRIIKQRIQKKLLNVLPI